MSECEKHLGLSFNTDRCLGCEIQRLQVEVADYSRAMVAEEKRAEAAEAKLAAIEKTAAGWVADCMNFKCTGLCSNTKCAGDIYAILRGEDA